MFNIRPAAAADIPLIRELTYQVWPQTYQSILSAEQIAYMLERMYSVASLEKQMEEGCRFILVYEGEEPVGFASFQEMKPGLFKLHKLYVLPSQQGKGTGRSIVSYVLDEMEKKGGNTLQLQVNKNNPAKIFYEKLGFTAVDEIDLDIGNGYFMNDYIMEIRTKNGGAY